MHGKDLQKLKISLLHSLGSRLKKNMGKTSAHSAAQNKLSRFRLRRNRDQTEFCTFALFASFCVVAFSCIVIMM